MDRGVLTSHYIRVNLQHPSRAKSYRGLNLTFAAEILQTALIVPILFFLLKSPAKASIFKLIHYICIIPKQD